MLRILSLCFLMALALPAHSRELVQIVFDDTAYIQDSVDPDEKKGARFIMTNFIRSLEDTYADDYLILISQFSGKTIWEGLGENIIANDNYSLFKFIKGEFQGCSSFEGLGEHLKNNALLQKADSHRVIFFSSLIHTGINPCKVPKSAKEAIPDQFLADLLVFFQATRAEFEFFWLYDSPDLRLTSRLLAWLSQNGLAVNIKNEAQTTEIFR